VLEWANKAPAETTPVAILIELGLGDTKAAKTRDWSGSAKVNGAKVVHREGYRFRAGAGAGDKLLDGDAWQASSHAALPAPPKHPAVSKMEPIASVGVVLHLTDIEANASLVIEPKNDEFSQAIVTLKDVLAGKSQTLWEGAGVVRLVSTAAPVSDAKTED